MENTVGERRFSFGNSAHKSINTNNNKRSYCIKTYPHQSVFSAGRTQSCKATSLSLVPLLGTSGPWFQKPLVGTLHGLSSFANSSPTCSWANTSWFKRGPFGTSLSTPFYRPIRKRGTATFSMTWVLFNAFGQCKCAKSFKD